MSISKPIPEAPQVKRNLCPICGKPSYSRDGIHPQCSLDRADAVRFDKIREQRKLDAKVEKPKTKRHLSKTCPDCGANMHVRVNACSCGHEFVKRVAVE